MHVVIEVKKTIEIDGKKINFVGVYKGLPTTKEMIESPIISHKIETIRLKAAPEGTVFVVSKKINYSIGYPPIEYVYKHTRTSFYKIGSLTGELTWEITDRFIRQEMKLSTK